MAQLSLLQHVANFRDVGQTVNKYLGQRYLRQGLLYRSARLDDASVQDQTRIRDQFGVKTVVDLRTKTELIKQADKYQPCAASHASSWFSPRPDIPRIDGIVYEDIKITGRPFEIHLLRQLSWWNLLKVVALFILGYRVDAVKVIATRVMLPRGLLGLGIDTVDHSGAEICQALSVFSRPQSMPALVHCTQGKDRTGLIIILILMILDIPTDAIEHDYLLTDAALESDREERLAEIRQLGLTDDWAVTSPVMVSGLKGHLDLQYGGLENYLDGIGFDAAQRTNLRQLLLY